MTSKGCVNVSGSDIYTRNSDKRFTLRMNQELFDKITVLAKRHRRSVAKEIEEAVEMYINYAEDSIVEDIEEK